MSLWTSVKRGRLWHAACHRERHAHERRSCLQEHPIYPPRRAAKRTQCRPGTTTRGAQRKKETPAGACANGDATLEANAPRDVAKAVGFAGEGELAVADHSPICAYLHELRAYPLMTREEEHDTAVLFSKNADSALAACLVTANLRLVVKIAQEYRRQHTRSFAWTQGGPPPIQ